MLVSVFKCSSPITLFLVSITCTSSSLASFHYPLFLYIDARLAMLVSVSGCPSLSTLKLVSIIYTFSSSASFRCP